MRPRMIGDFARISRISSSVPTRFSPIPSSARNALASRSSGYFITSRSRICRPACFSTCAPTSGSIIAASASMYIRSRSLTAPFRFTASCRNSFPRLPPDWLRANPHHAIALSGSNCKHHRNDRSAS